MQELIYGGGLRGRVLFLISREDTGEDHRVGLNIYKPMGDTKGREWIQQTTEASSIRGFPRGFPEQGAGTTCDGQLRRRRRNREHSRARDRP